MRILLLHLIFYFISVPVTLAGTDEENKTLRQLDEKIRTLKASNQEIQRAIDTTNANVRSADGTIGKLNSTIETAQRQGLALRLKSSSVTTETRALQQRKDFATAEAKKLSKQLTEVEAEKGKLKQAISELIQEKFILAQKIEALNQRKDKLEAIAPQIKNITELLDGLFAKAANIDTELNKLNQMHINWIAQLKSNINRYQPDWKSINSNDTYKEQYAKVIDFTRNAPEQAALTDAETPLLAQIKQSQSQASEILSKIRALVADPNLAVLTQTQKINDDLKQLKEMDPMIGRYGGNLAKIEFSIKEFKAKRNYLLQGIPITWKNLFASMLSKLNIEKGRNLIISSELELKGAEIYMAIHGELEQIKNQGANALYQLNAPFYARRMALSGKQYIKNLHEKIDRYKLNDAVFAAKIKDMAADYARAFNELFSQAHYASTVKLPRYTNEIKKEMGSYTNKLDSGDNTILSKQANIEECKALAHKTLKEPSQTRLEYSFMEFQRRCLR